MRLVCKRFRGVFRSVLKHAVSRVHRRKSGNRQAQRILPLARSRYTWFDGEREPMLTNPHSESYIVVIPRWVAPQPFFDRIYPTLAKTL